MTNRSLGSAPSFALPLHAGALVLGRGVECDLALADRYLSHRHVELLVKGSELSFRDLGSSTSCFLDGRETRVGVLLPGARLVAGRTELQVLPAGPQFTSEGETRPAPAEPRAAAITEGQPFRALVEGLLRSAHPRDLLERLLRGLVELLRAERGFVLLEDRPGGKLVPVASHQLADPSTFAAVSSTVYQHALETGRTVHVANSLADAMCAGSKSLMLDGVARMVVCAPLSAGGATFGVIYLDRPAGGEDASPATLQMMETFTGLASELASGQRIRETLVATQGRLDGLAGIVSGDERLVLGEGKAAAETRCLVDQAAGQDVSVLITGETGTGKEMVARALHQASPRRHGPFIAVSCGALPPDLLDAELFGAERGAFTGASERRIGRFELATGGTLFLDEVGELPGPVQVKLLRVLQERSLTRMGSSQPVPLDFRLVSATNRDLEQAVKDGTVRSDFYFRINVFRIHLKPLAERPEDILPLARSFLERLAPRAGKKLAGFSPDAERALRCCPWLGNVRELHNAVERAVVVERSGVVQLQSLPFPRGGDADGAPDPLAEQRLVAGLPTLYEPARESFDRAFLRRALELHDGNITAVARETGLTRPTIYKWLEKLGLLNEVPGGSCAGGGGGRRS